MEGMGGMGGMGGGMGGAGMHPMEREVRNIARQMGRNGDPMMSDYGMSKYD